MAIATVPRETFGALVRQGETLEQARIRLERTKGYTKTIGTPAGQALLEAINAGRGSEVLAPVPTIDGPAGPQSFPQAARSPARLVEIPLASVDVGSNVRVTLEAIDELTESVREHGVLQPVKVLRVGTGGDRPPAYRLLWGQRRVLAARQAGLTRIPAIVLEGDETSLTEDTAARSVEQLVENLHRADLNPIDRATAMRAVVDSGVSQVDLARKLGIAPSTVANDLRILGLDPKVVEQIRAGQLTASHGKAIASLPPKQQAEMAKVITEERLSAHALESRLKWKQDEAVADQARAKRTEKWIPKVVRALEAAEVPKTAEINLGSAAYKVDEHKLRAGLSAAGWNQHNYGYRSSRPSKGCDCTAVRVDLGGLKPTVELVCSEPEAHGQRDDATARYQAARALRERRISVLAGAIDRDLRASGISQPVLVLLWRSSGGWGDPPADICSWLARAVGQRIRDEELAQVFASLGVDLPDADEAAS